MNSAGPYTELLGQDVYNNGRRRAQPAGVARNTLAGAGFVSLDLRASHDFALTNDRVVTVGVDTFNVINHVNYTTFVGTVGSPFLQPVSARSPRQLQFSASHQILGARPRNGYVMWRSSTPAGEVCVPRSVTIASERGGQDATGPARVETRYLA